MTTRYSSTAHAASTPERADTCEIAGKSIAIELVGVFDVGPEGRITRWRDYYDLSAVVEQVAAATAAGS